MLSLQHENSGLEGCRKTLHDVIKGVSQHKVSSLAALYATTGLKGPLNKTGSKLSISSRG